MARGYVGKSENKAAYTQGLIFLQNNRKRKRTTMQYGIAKK